MNEAKFQAKLREYAKLIVKIGANVQKGQRVRLQTGDDSFQVGSCTDQRQAALRSTAFNRDAAQFSAIDHQPDAIDQIGSQGADKAKEIVFGLGAGLCFQAEEKLPPALATDVLRQRANHPAAVVSRCTATRGPEILVLSEDRA